MDTFLYLQWNDLLHIVIFKYLFCCAEDNIGSHDMISGFLYK